MKLESNTFMQSTLHELLLPPPPPPLLPEDGTYLCCVCFELSHSLLICKHISLAGELDELQPLDLDRLSTACSLLFRRSPHNSECLWRMYETESGALFNQLAQLIIDCYCGANFRDFFFVPPSANIFAIESVSRSVHTFLATRGNVLSTEQHAMLECALATRADMEAFKMRNQQLMYQSSQGKGTLPVLMYFTLSQNLPATATGMETMAATIFRHV